MLSFNQWLAQFAAIRLDPHSAATKEAYQRYVSKSSSSRQPNRNAMSAVQIAIEKARLSRENQQLRSQLAPTKPAAQPAAKSSSKIAPKLTAEQIQLNEVQAATEKWAEKQNERRRHLLSLTPAGRDALKAKPKKSISELVKEYGPAPSITSKPMAPARRPVAQASGVTPADLQSLVDAMPTHPAMTPLLQPGETLESLDGSGATLQEPTRRRW